MTKIGILTYSREYANLGTNMQCYCTLKAVREAYPNVLVEIVNYSPYPSTRTPYLTGLSVRSLINDCRRFRKYDTFFQEELTFGKDSLTSQNVKTALAFIRKQQYDAIYVGSDTVLELRHCGAAELNAYWLDESIDSVKFMVAASSHSLTVEALSDIQKHAIRKTLKSFALLGSRDDATFRLLSHFTEPGDDRLHMVPDPTFIYDLEYAYIEQYLDARNLDLTKPMVCLHLLRDSAWGPTLAAYLREKGYIIASFRPAAYADITFTDLSPFEQMGIYKYFSLVITHRFHDAIFCFKNLTPVIVFAENVADRTTYGESKLQTLLKSFNADGIHYIANKRTLTAEYLLEIHEAAIIQFKNNEAVIRSVLQRNREVYRSFIERSTHFVT